ncbi:MAG: hypothetical protein FWG70_03780 [Oscillospiraceae bacterium]|nr:hypothetical protein [Oscillospiraceae bacterium]
MKGHAILKTIIALLIITLVYLAYTHYEDEPYTPIELPSLSSNVEKIKVDTPPIPFPETSTALTDFDFYQYSSFRVEPPTDSELNYFIRLKHIDNNDYNIDFYIKNGETLDTLVLNGEYYMYCASGIEWYGEEYLFGTTTLFRSAGSLLFYFDYEKNASAGHVIALQPVTSGNFPTTPVSISDFVD